jgi:endogenous inhibitor of DNA gyrase (YacG/DUF329 family)
MKSKKKKGYKKVKCPKCGYLWKTKQKGYICCSRCKRYFGRYKK